MKKIYILLLTLSVATVTTHAATQTFKYKIKSGDSLYSIAKKNHTTIEKVRQANGIKNDQVLKIGKIVKIPTNKKIAKQATKTKSVRLSNYSIKKGDTLSGIAKKHNTTAAKLSKTNGIKKGTTLKLGRIIQVPKTNYNVVKNKLQNKKLVASISNLDTVSLKSTTKNKKSVIDKCKKIATVAKKKLGNRYVWGATGKRNCFDCSGFTKFVFKKNGIDIPRTSINQSKYGKFVKRSNLKKGDLIFFDTSKRRKGYVNHVGIYLGDNKFIHASSAKKKVVITSLDKNFYSNRYKGARRPL